MMFGNVPATTASPPTRVVASSPVEQHTSDAGANLAHVANRPRAAEVAGRILERIRSGVQHVQHMFEGVRNLFARGVRHEAAPMPAPSAANLSEVLLDTGSKSLLNAIPTMASMLESNDAGWQDCDKFKEAFRTVTVGVRTFDILATEGVARGTVPKAVAEQIQALLEPTMLVANDETSSQLWNRLNGGDNAFLADARVRAELLEHLEKIRDAVVAFVDTTGQEDLAGRLYALCRPGRLISWDLNRAASGSAQSQRSSSPP